MKIIDQKPDLFEKPTCNIWTNPHIQLQMLHEHLNPQSDGASRKQESIARITDFILSRSNPQSRLLDLECGPLGTHSDKDRDKLLKNIYYSLDAGGVFIFDIFTEDITKDKQEGKSWDYAPNGGFWNKDEYLLLSQTFHYPENNAFAYQYNLLTKKEAKHFIVWDRYYSEEEISQVLQDTGFRKVSIHKNILDDNNFTSNSEMFVVAEK